MSFRNLIRASSYKKVASVTLPARRGICTTSARNDMKVQLREVPYSDFAPKFKPRPSTAPFQNYEPRETDNILYSVDSSTMWLYCFVCVACIGAVAYHLHKEDMERIRQQKAGVETIAIRYMWPDEEDMPPAKFD